MTNAPMNEFVLDDDFWRIQKALDASVASAGLWPSSEAWFKDFRQVLTQADIVPRNDHEWRERIRQHLPYCVVPSSGDLQQQWVKHEIDTLIETLKRTQ